MREKWIGEQVNTGGSYQTTECPELSVRIDGSGPINAKKLYKFNSRFDEQYCISDTKVIEEIDELLVNGESTELYEYLYKLVIQRFGVIEFLVRIGHVIAAERDSGYKKGKAHKEQEIREALGLR